MSLRKAKCENMQDADVSSLTNSKLSGANISIMATGDNDRGHWT